MQFLSLAFLSLLTLTTAAPVAKPEPEPVPAFPSGSNVITPREISLYNTGNGAITYRSGTGRVLKTGTGSDTTTLITFDIPSAAVGRTLEFGFTLDTAASSVVSGSQLLDVYKSLGPATRTTTGWGQGVPGNQRDQHQGRLRVVRGGEATYLTQAQGFPVIAKSFAAPSAPGVLAFELVGVYDRDEVSWDAAVNGAFLRWT
ncbi:hypothetical protein B0J11DRAFT_507796 [Dendryphion nanum]|uniref:Uncharacterized protein n=1 Tax=Dendryphion nanum TaxID=256645 RepID=A0A9P9IIP5_9PLEO|nr:hypothetical protein B0J11DRAFT_507796 [Dendryphion nanum]